MTLPNASYLTRVAVAACIALPVIPAGARAQSSSHPQSVSSPHSQTASDTASLTPVVVTATKVPLAETVPTASTTVITGEDLRARGIATVAEALKDVAGATVVQSGSFGSQTSLFLRGGQSGYVKVLLDGVPLNQPGGPFSFDYLTTANVDRIEILRGPASVLYGSDAMSGVIQIFTVRGSGPIAGYVAANGGNYTTFDGTADVSGGLGPFGYSAGGDRQSTSGILPFNNQMLNGEMSGRLDYGLNTPTSAAVTARYHTMDYHFPTVGDGRPVDHNQYSRDEGSSFALDAAHSFSRVFDGHILLTSNSQDVADINPPDVPAADSTFSQSFQREVDQRMGVDARLDAHIGGAVITAGGSEEGQTDRTRSSDAFAAGGGSADTSITAPVARFRRIGAAYAQVVGNVGNLASYTAGVRLDDNSAFGTYGTYRVGVGYAIGTGGQLHASFGSAYKEPTFEQNFSAVPFDSGNTKLRPEHSIGWEAGISETPFGQGLTLSGTYFNQLFENIVDYTPVSTILPGSTTPTNYVNVAGARADGIELAFLAGPVAGASISLAYTILRTRVTDVGFDTSGTGQYIVGDRLIRRPSHEFSGTFRHSLANKGSFGVTAHFVGTRDDINFDSDTRVVLAGYTTWDLVGDYRLLQGSAHGPNLSLTARVVNLFNRRYDEIATYAAPGRTVLVGGRIEVTR
jgi:vitamin B12 transporter